MTPKTVQFDILVPTAHRPEALERCLCCLSEAVRAARGRATARILVCVSGNDQESWRLVESRARLDPGIAGVFSEEGLSPAQSRNRLLLEAQAEWILFVDDDARVPPDILTSFLDVLSDRSTATAAAVGGPNITPKESSLFQRASGAALASAFGSFRSAVRYRERAQRHRCGEEALTSCNLFVRRSVLERKPFPEQLVSNEENWMLQSLLARGGRLIFEPKLRVWHERRKTPARLARQIFRYGRGRGQNSRRRPSTARYYHFIPSACVLFTIIALAAWPLMPVLLQVWSLCAAVYLGLGLWATGRMVMEGAQGRRAGAVGGLLFPLIHVSYGLGVLRGLIRDG